jgi:Fe-Mn family superoxide dismutase
MYPFSLPDLGYNDAALEPYIDAQTMGIHRTKHHQNYVNKTNEVLANYPQLQKEPLEKLLANLEGLKMEDKDKTALRNNGGGHLNHSLYWKVMDPKNKVDESLIDRIKKTFGSVEDFKKKFSGAASSRFGSGWAWFAEDDKGELTVYSTANQDSPYLKNHTPVICLDVWEHAYYLKYQNRRPEYIEAWWDIMKLV